MTETYFGNSALQPVTLSYTTLNGLVSGSFATSAVFACPSQGSGEACERGFVRINFGAAFTMSSTAPVIIQAKCVSQADGTNLPNLYASGGQLYPPDGVGQATFPATGVAPEWVDIPVELLPGNIAIAILNQTGNPFPASGVTATLYAYMTATG